MEVIIALVVLLMLGLLVVALRSILSAKRLRCRESWNQLVSHLRRRCEILPNLASAAKRSAPNATDLLKRLQTAREDALEAKGVRNRSQAEGQLTALLEEVITLPRTYPALKANEQFVGLREELISAENNIDLATTQYNAAADAYEQAIRSFPTSLGAKLFGFRPMARFSRQPGQAE